MCCLGDLLLLHRTCSGPGENNRQGEPRSQSKFRRSGRRGRHTARRVELLSGEDRRQIRHYPGIRTDREAGASDQGHRSTEWLGGTPERDRCSAGRQIHLQRLRQEQQIRSHGQGRHRHARDRVDRRVRQGDRPLDRQIVGFTTCKEPVDIRLDRHRGSAQRLHTSCLRCPPHGSQIRR